MIAGKKLIEVALPLALISEASAYEQSVKRGKPSQIHKWWARRPSSAARAVLWASLIDDPSSRPDLFPDVEAQRVERDRLFAVLEDILSWNVAHEDPRMLVARNELDKVLGADGVVVLDPFGGGGTISLEAQRLGLRTSSGDLNPVAVLIQRAMLQIPAMFSDRPAVHPSSSALLDWSRAQGLAADVQAYGLDLLQAAEARLGAHYPQVVDPTTGQSLIVTQWIWARTVKSPDPSFPFHVPLVGSWQLATNGAVVTWIESKVDRDSGHVSYHIRNRGKPPQGTMDGGDGVCLATGTPIPAEYIKQEGVAGRIGHDLIAIVAEGTRSRTYLDPSETQRIAALGCPEAGWKPSGMLSTHPQYMGTPRYGLDEWWKLFTKRQLYMLTTFSDLLPEMYQRIARDGQLAGLPSDGTRLRDGGTGSAAYADAIVTYLALAIDRLADWNSSLCRWEKKAAVSQQIFSDKAIKMVWDYAEANPLASSTGSLRATLKTMGTAIEAIPRQSAPADIAQRDAQARVIETGVCAVSTDPPYYAQVPYADISDFFYVWLRRNLGEIWPDECATLVTPKIEELVADEKRHGSRVLAAQFFEKGIERVFHQVAQNQDPRFPATIFYAFKATEVGTATGPATGWETFLAGLLKAGLTVTATWPIRTENRSRMRALGSNVLASSVVLACRPRPATAVRSTRAELIATLRAEMPRAIRLLQEQSIAPVDLAQAAIGPGIAVFSRFQSVVEVTGDAMTVRTALALINEVLGQVLSGEESEFDAETRFALTWFEQYGHNPGPFGDADLLSRAKDTSVESIVDAGLAVSRDGRLTLLDRKELATDWDPRTDSRFTVWEATQYLIRALESSEREAATLLRAIGAGIGERARQLSYLVFEICGRRKWSDEAIPYNMLVVAWPEISRLAAATPTPEAEHLLF